MLIRYNQLSAVPASLANCTKIDEFNIEGNNVSELPVSKSLSKFIVSCYCCLTPMSQMEVGCPGAKVEHPISLPYLQPSHEPHPQPSPSTHHTETRSSMEKIIRHGTNPNPRPKR